MLYWDWHPGNFGLPTRDDIHCQAPWLHCLRLWEARCPWGQELPRVSTEPRELADTLSTKGNHCCVLSPGSAHLGLQPPFRLACAMCVRCSFIERSGIPVQTDLCVCAVLSGCAVLCP